MIELQEQFTDENKKKRKKKRIAVVLRSLLLLGFFLTLNIFAWFIYVTKVDTTFDLQVASWEVIFSNNGTDVRDITIQLDILPGMEDYEYEIAITNSSDVAAKIEFEVYDATLFGQPMYPTSTANAEKKRILQNDYPFSIQLLTPDTEIGKLQQGAFNAKISWEFENNNYYKVLDPFEFDDSVTYYVKNGSTYVSDNTVTATNFSSKKANLYLEKDDIDSYIGQRCGSYTKTTGKRCLQVTGRLSAQQIAQ